MVARCLMVQGTASSVGKSILVAALCRILRQDGYRVAPFKAQNMALNSFVTPEGGEIGRAQAVQAQAAGIAPAVIMNPILLKPEADARAQLVVLGKPVAALPAAEFYRRKDSLWPIVTEALDRLRAEYDIVVLEGAGSPAEVNLKDGDIVNMRVARHADAAVLLVGDIDRGGIFASLLGTLDLLDPVERALVRGLVVNKFRGDASLLRPGLRFLEQRSGKPVFGVIPFLPDLGLADEDSVALENVSSRSALPRCPECGARLVPGDDFVFDVAILRLPHVANFDDFDPLQQESGVSVRYVDRVAQLGAPDLIILPGTKTTLADLAWLRSTGLAGRLVELARLGTALLGVCGGYQMLGEQLCDPFGVEGGGDVPGLGLLPLKTVFDVEKATYQVAAEVATHEGIFAGLGGVAIRGYEIHAGRSVVDPASQAGPAFRVVERAGRPALDFDGLVGADGSVAGTYIHGLFDDAVFRRGLLQRLAERRGRRVAFGAPPPSHDDALDRLADHVRRHLDCAALYRMVRGAP